MLQAFDAPESLDQLSGEIAVKERSTRMDNSSVMGQMRSLWGMVRLYLSLRMILAKKRASNRHARIEAFEGHLVGVCECMPARFFVTHRPGDDG